MENLLTPTLIEFLHTHPHAFSIDNFRMTTYDPGQHNEKVEIQFDVSISPTDQLIEDLKQATLENITDHLPPSLPTRPQPRPKDFPDHG